jgi:hypothetical protein
LVSKHIRTVVHPAGDRPPSVQRNQRRITPSACGIETSDCHGFDDWRCSGAKDDGGWDGLLIPSLSLLAESDVGIAIACGGQCRNPPLRRRGNSREHCYELEQAESASDDLVVQTRTVFSFSFLYSYSPRLQRTRLDHLGRYSSA